jgi:phosphoadenosine phosphosulfate reductase
MYKSIAVLLLLLVCVHGYRMSLKMGLDPVLSKSFARDFKTIPFGTDYGMGSDETQNKEGEARKMSFLEGELMMDLKKAVGSKTTPMFTTALIAGDAVILDALAKADLLQKVPVVFVDTFTLFPESLAHLREVEKHYGFESKIYNAVGCSDQEDYYSQYGRDYWMKDIDQYDMLCKVEPMNRALAEQNSDCWINGRRRDHGAERASLPVWEGKKVRHTP